LNYYRLRHRSNKEEEEEEEECHLVLAVSEKVEMA
jgi:hypothetical protein